MKQSGLFGRTVKDVSKDAPTAAHGLLIRGGYIRPMAPGLFAYLPLLTRVLTKLERLLGRPWDQFGGCEMTVPLLQPAERRRALGENHHPDHLDFMFNDHRGASLVLSEEAAGWITDLAPREITSHKDLPQFIYRRHSGFRNDPRPRHGLIGAREFPAHSGLYLDKDESGHQESIRRSREILTGVFHRIGLTCRTVEGQNSLTFIGAGEGGEDAYVFCDRCGYAATLDRAESRLEEYDQDRETRPLEPVYGPGLIGVGPLAEFLNLPVWKTTKAILFQADTDVVCVLVRGDCDVNEAKVRDHLKCRSLTLAAPAVITELTGAQVGYAGPIGLPPEIKVIADRYVDRRVNFECGANRTDYHYINVNFDRDLQRPFFGDFKTADTGHGCPRCSDGVLGKTTGIALGQVTWFGTDLSQAAGCTFLDQQGRPQPIYLGGHRLNLARILAAVVDQHHDAAGVIWAPAIAPYQVHLIGLNLENETVAAEAEHVYQRLLEIVPDVLFDDRPARAGEKFGDADLIGAPIRITLSKRTVEEKKLELKFRDQPDKATRSYDETFQQVQGWRRENLAD